MTFVVVIIVNMEWSGWRNMVLIEMNDAECDSMHWTSKGLPVGSK